MGKPYPLGLRERVLAAIESGTSRNQPQFGVAISTAIGWRKRIDQTGSLLLARSGVTSRRRFRETMRSGCRNGSRTATSPYAGSSSSLSGAARMSSIARCGTSRMTRSSASKRTLSDSIRIVPGGVV